MSDQATPQLATFPKLDAAGTPATLRVLLPPNFAAAAPRDAIAVRFEVAIERGGTVPAGMVPESRALAVPAAHLSGVFLIESWNGGRPASFAQLSRAQLGALLAVLQGEPVFFMSNRPRDALAWTGSALDGVSEHLGPPPPTGQVDAAVPSRVAPPSSARVVPTAPPSRSTLRPAVPSRSAAHNVPSPSPGSGPSVDGSEHFLSIQLPSREHPSYTPVLEVLKAFGFRLEPSNRRWWLRDRHRTLEFLAQYWTRLEDEWQAGFSENFRRNTSRLVRAEIDCTIENAGDGFEVTMTVEAGGAPEREIAAAITAGRPAIEHEGRVHLLDRARLQRLHDAQRALGGSVSSPLLGRSRHRISRARAAEADAALEAASPNLRAPTEWRRRTEFFRNPGALTPAPADPSIAGLLRPYQKLGAAWLWHLREHELGGILADEMGLGKTLQALAVISGVRRAHREAAPCLVVCPASLMENWRREAARFVPSLRVVLHHGSDRAEDAAPLSAADLVITSYGVLTRDKDLLHSISWDLLVADEAQHVKNRRSQNARALRGVRARARILLTGTPVENSLADLESLFAIVLPGYMPAIPGDLRGPDRAWHEARVRRQAAPYILRRTKAQVAPELPEKIEQTLYIEMSTAQRALYEAIRRSSEAELQNLELAGRSEGSIRMAVFTQLLRLRQVCGDPRLIEPARDPAESAKLAALFELLDEALDDGHRVLVFSQFTSLLALVRAELEARGAGYAYLDGAMPAKARQAEVDRFNAGGADVPVFLLSLKAGGTGLNLATADTVVHLDPWWNPAAEAQATDRAHRIGQTRVVTSYKLIAADSVEERVLDLQREKRALLANVFDEADAANAALTLADMRALLG